MSLEEIRKRVEKIEEELDTIKLQLVSITRMLDASREALNHWMNRWKKL
jgi:archaellum component FlaC